MRQAGWEINRKRIQRLWREEGLQVRRCDAHCEPTFAPQDWSRKPGPNLLWTVYAQPALTDDGRALTVVSIMDEHGPEVLANVVQRNPQSDRLVAELNRLVQVRNATPSTLHYHGGPSATGYVLLQWAGRYPDTEFIAAEAGGQQPRITSLATQLREECLIKNKFGSLAHAKVVIQTWTRNHVTLQR